MNQLEPLQQLISRLARLPGVGRRSAERMALRLATDQRGLRRELFTALQAVDEQVMCCTRCGNLTMKTRDPCVLCTDPRRKDELLCVVEDPGGIQLVEAAGAYSGRYFCLMGKLSPLQGKDVSPQVVRRLVDRIQTGGVREVILALDSDVESDATSSYLHDMLASTSVKISRLAFGIPAGSGLAYSDPVTLARALDGRQSI